MRKCVICEVPLEGSQRLFCSNKCKQVDKYDRQRGLRCRHCHKGITKPVPKIGGWEDECKRKSCIDSR